MSFSYSGTKIIQIFIVTNRFSHSWSRCIWLFHSFFFLLLLISSLFALSLRVLFVNISISAEIIELQTNFRYNTIYFPPRGDNNSLRDRRQEGRVVDFATDSKCHFCDVTPPDAVKGNALGEREKNRLIARLAEERFCKIEIGRVEPID
jgi:hypothetical protein